MLERFVSPVVAMKTTSAVCTCAIAMLTAACAGSTYRSGVGDAQLGRPPYYAGRSALPLPLGHLPIVYQRGATGPEFFDPKGDVGTPVGVLLQEMNAHLDAMNVTTRLSGNPADAGTAPDVRFGCETAPDGDCVDGEIDGTDDRRLHLSVTRASQRWTSWFGTTLDSAGVSGAIMITLEVGHYWTRQKNWRGSKEVQLGTGHVVALPWLTSLETPVSVLQLTGALIDRDGRAVRIGAEGLLARRTDLMLSSIGAQELITDEDVALLRTARREDRPGAPLTWQVALENLVAQLTSRPRAVAP